MLKAMAVVTRSGGGVGVHGSRRRPPLVKVDLLDEAGPERTALGVALGDVDLEVPWGLVPRCVCGASADSASLSAVRRSSRPATTRFLPAVNRPGPAG
jgi:hypothetical protein